MIIKSSQRFNEILLDGFVQPCPSTALGLQALGPLAWSRQDIACAVYLFAGKRLLIVQDKALGVAWHFFVVSVLICTR